MTRFCYDGQRWTADIMKFQTADESHGPLAVWHGQQFGASSACAVLGPDSAAPGCQGNNPPQAVGRGWDQAWPHAPPNGAGPPHPFAQDMQNVWKRGHLINGEWGGSGSDWDNLTPLTAQGNSNHSTVEQRMKVFLENFRAFDQAGNGQPNYWYALRYWVQVATAPWSAQNLVGELYSYCPNMIKVTWRILRLNKPVGAANTAAQTFINRLPIWFNANLGAAAGATNNQIGTDLPNLPRMPVSPTGVLTNTPANVNERGGQVHQIPVGAPAIPAPANAWDGDVEVFQD